MARAGRAPHPAATGQQPTPGWELAPLRAPSRATAGCPEPTRKLQHTSEHTEPLGHDPGRHQMMPAAHTNAAHNRSSGRLSADNGAVLDLPFYDDRMVETVPAVAPPRARRAVAVQTLAAREEVVSVSLCCAGQNCPQRPIATALLCRTRGSRPTRCTGMRTNPFTAHA